MLDEFCLTKNSVFKNGGCSPSQWVLGKTPREAPSLVSEDQFAVIGKIKNQVDPAFQHQARLGAWKAFIHLDTSKRVQQAFLRSAKPTLQAYSVGDMVCFRKDNQPGGQRGHPPHVSLAMKEAETKMYGFYASIRLRNLYPPWPYLRGRRI